MSETRKIRRIVTGSNQVDGAGVKLVRVIGRADTDRRAQSKISPKSS